MGLALVKAFTEMLHGTVTAANRQPQGARFTIEFPVSQPNSDASQTAGVEETERQMAHEEAVDTQKANAEMLTASEKQEPRKRILVVDDNADIRAYLASWLGKYYQVSSAADGRGDSRRRAVKPPTS